MNKWNFGLWPIWWTIMFTCSHKMFEVNYFGGKYKQSAAPLMSSIVLKSSVKSCFDEVVFEDAVIIYISVLNFCFTGNLLMFHSCEDCKTVIRDKGFFQSKTFLGLGLKSFISRNIRRFFQCFFFLSLESYFQKSKKSSVSWKLFQSRFLRIFLRKKFWVLWQKSVLGSCIYYYLPTCLP